MKEKTIEEKAKAYDEFLKRAKERYNKDHDNSEDLEYIFGDDLKENEEEKLIETLINFFTHYKIEKVGEFTNNQIAGWLKKQLEKPEKYEWNGKITSRKAKGELSTLLEGLESRKKFDNRPIFRIGDILKKKGKDYTFTVDRIQGGYYFCERNNGAFFPIEEQYDWELLDDGKTSPKFKTGDWITNGLCTFKISSIDDNYYWGHEGTVGGDIESTNDQYHLWSIEDAEDGDVLASHDCFVVFKEIEGPNIKCYCTYHYMGFNPSFSTDTLHNKTAFHPATKEECEILLQKAKEAGYEWNKEKKEPKKIKEQKPIDEAKSDTKQNLTWSEEDEVMCQETIDWFEQKCFPYASEEENPAKKSIQWLKSLKQRMGK